MYDSISVFYEGYAPVKEMKYFLNKRVRDGKWGFVDKKMNLVVPYVYDRVSHFRNGLAYFSISATSFDIECYIDAKGTRVWRNKRQKKQ